jgi:non-heme chloroperoxidase
MSSKRGTFRVEVQPGIEVFVQDLGQGRPVVLLAGFGLDHQVWDAQIRRLAGKGHRSVCVDLRGTGESDKPLTGYELERLADDVVAVIEELDLRRATIAGWSFGGQVGFRVAASVPDRIAQLVLVASNGVRASRSENFPFGRPPEDTEPALIGAEKNGRLAARRATIGDAFAAKPHPEILEWLVRISMQMPSWAAIACYRSMVRGDLLADLPRIKVPVLQLFGTSDPAHSGKGASWVAEQLSDSRIVGIPDCGHFPMFEAPEAFDEAFLDFVTAGPGS